MTWLFYFLKFFIVIQYAQLLYVFFKSKHVDHSIRFSIGFLSILEFFGVLAIAILCVCSIYHPIYASFINILTLLVAAALYFQMRRFLFIGDRYVILRLKPHLIKEIFEMKANLYSIEIYGKGFACKILHPIITHNDLETKLYKKIGGC